MQVVVAIIAPAQPRRHCAVTHSHLYRVTGGVVGFVHQQDLDLRTDGQKTKSTHADLRCMWVECVRAIEVREENLSSTTAYYFAILSQVPSKSLRVLAKR